MPPRSPLDYDVSVSADKRRRTRRRGMTGAIEDSRRACDRPGCESVGQYRAPKSPELLDDYYWFCLDHVREYNKSWNYFANCSEDELERHIRADSVWGRPTWRFGEQPRKPLGMEPHAEGQAWRRFGFDDPLEVLGENATINPGAAGRDRPRPPRRMLPPTERRALETLGATDVMTKTEIRAIYKGLVKDLHPDMNAGRRDDEDRLREVLWAWEQIKGSRSFPE